MDSKDEQRVNIKFCVRLGKNTVETIALMKQAYGDDSLSPSAIKRWHAEFLKDLNKSPMRQYSSGRPNSAVTEININTVRAAIDEDRHLSIRALEGILNLSRMTIQRILTDRLGMKRVCSTWVPHMLTRAQLDLRVERANEVLGLIAEDPTYLDRVITCDESWVHYHDPLSKRESEEWRQKGEPRPKKVRQQKSAGKVMLLAFFDHKGLIYQHFVKNVKVKGKRRNFTSTDYLKVLKTLQRHINKKRPELKNRWILHHDNVRPHTARVVTEWLEQQNIETVPHPPYSPDLAPCDFWLFPTLKKALRGRRFNSDEEVKQAVYSAFQKLPPTEFHKTIKVKWEERLEKCIVSRGQYFEKAPAVENLSDDDTDDE